MLVSSEPRGLDPEIVKPGWLGLIVVVVLALGVVVLARSFAKHTRRASQPWEGEESADGTDPPQDED